MEGHHEVRKSCVQSTFSVLEVKMGRGGQDEWRENLESLRMRKKAASWVVGHFPSRSVVEMPDIQGAFRLVIFSVFCLHGILFGVRILNWVPNFPAWSATVADTVGRRCAVVWEAEGSWVLAASWNWARRAKTMSQQRRAGSASLRRSVRIREKAWI